MPGENFQMRKTSTRRPSKGRTAKRRGRSPHAGARPLTKRPPEWGTRSPTYEARMQAAGFSGDDPVPKNIDVFRNRLARRIAMFVNNWHGCPEPLCRRQRGCMAPHIHCTNTLPVETTPEQTARTMALVHRTVRELADKRAAEEGE
jgi:hypothetical protein